MTLKNRINHEELFRLAGNPEGRNDLLLRVFSDGQRGLTRERLDSIRQPHDSLYARVHFASEVLFHSLAELGVPSMDIHAQFTVENLAAIVYEEWNNPEQHKETLRVAIRGKHREELETKKRIFNFDDLTYPQLFRETISHKGIPLYQGNLYGARDFWKKFQPSNEDFLLNILIPERIGPVEALLLGICWTDGYLRKSESASLTLSIEGEQSDLNTAYDINFYGDLVAHLLKAVHNYGPISGNSYVHERRTRRGAVEHYPSFEINSAAICTWLRDDIGFPPQQRTIGIYEPKKIPFEHLKGSEAQKGFFAGIVAGLGAINDDGTILFEHKDREFIENAAKLSRMLGYHPSSISSRDYSISGKYHREKPRWYFTLSVDDVARMISADLNTTLPHIGLFFNPKHYRKELVHPIL